MNSVIRSLITSLAKQDSGPSPFPGRVAGLTHYTSLDGRHVPAATIPCGLWSQKGSVSGESIVRSPCVCQTTLCELQSMWTLRLPLFCSSADQQRAAHGPRGCFKSKLSWQASHVPGSMPLPEASWCPGESFLTGVSPGLKELAGFLKAFDKVEGNTLKYRTFVRRPFQIVLVETRIRAVLLAGHLAKCIENAYAI